MRKILIQDMITVDGFFAGLHEEIGWHHVDTEFNEYAISVLDTVDTLLFGRVTYDLMASHWPTARAIEDDPIIAGKMNSLPKIVFSRSLEVVTWNNSKTLHGINADEILKMKQGTGKDIMIYGSGTVVSALTGLGLIDEYRLIVNPVILGKGKSLFTDVHSQPNLRLLETKTFASGNVLLSYKSA
jgi:dihydrofolate reductase